MAKRPAPIRPGELFRVVVPKRFVRCGYPLSHDDMIREIEQNKDALAALELLGEALGIFVGPSFFDEEGRILQADKIKRELAYAMLRQRGFGGRERTLHLEDMPEAEGKVLTVARVFSVVTGTYFPPCGYGDDDYDPGGLDGAKIHRIAEVYGLRVPRSDPHSRREPLMFPVAHLARFVSEEEDAA